MFCSRKFSVAKKFMDKKGEVKRQLSSFSVEIFCSHSITVPKKFVGEYLYASLFSGIEKTYSHALVQDFLSKFFCFTVRSKKIEREPFSVVFQKVS